MCRVVPLTAPADPPLPAGPGGASLRHLLPPAARAHRLCHGAGTYRGGGTPNVAPHPPFTPPFFSHSPQIDDSLASLVIAQLLFLQSESNKKPIHMYINSPGEVGGGVCVVGGFVGGHQADAKVFFDLRGRGGGCVLSCIPRRWGGDLGFGHLRHDAVRPQPGVYVVRGAGGQHGLPPASRRSPRPAPCPAQRPHHGAPALRGGTGTMVEGGDVDTWQGDTWETHGGGAGSPAGARRGGSVGGGRLGAKFW